MGDKTGIQWTDATWNPIRGCSRVSEGCRNCYAETVANRFKGPGQPYEGLIAKGGQWNGSITVVEHLMDWPLRKRKPMRIFVNSMSDLFHQNVPFDVIRRIMLQMAFANHHTYQVLTKRPARMLEFFEWWGTEAKRSFAAEMPHVWLGVSVEDQATADERIPLLLQTPAAVRWISAEPLLGKVTLPPLCDLSACGDHGGSRCDNATCHARVLDWVVVGGESGPHARPMHPEWARSLRDQCRDAGVPFFFKQWGEWADADNGPEDDFAYHGKHDCWVHFNGGYHTGKMGVDFFNCYPMYRIGKKSAGRLLDGREWNEYPS